MPRYYFDITDAGGLVVDDEGVELGSLHSAQEEAARTLGDMARDALRAATGGAVQQMTVEVRDDAGPLMNVRLSFEIERKD